MAEFAVELHEKQSPLFDEDNALFTVCVAGRRFGKTYAAAYKCIVEGLRAANKFKGLDDTSEVMYIAPTLERVAKVRPRTLAHAAQSPRPHTVAGRTI